MSRITISISDQKHSALKEMSARSGKTIGQIVEESLEFYGVKTSKQAADLVKMARKRASLTEDKALQIAVEETRKVRKKS